MDKFAIIVAGGSGKRMESKMPKQFLQVGKKAILMHTLEAFYSYDPEVQIILVLPEEHFDLWRSLERKYRFQIKTQLVKGGSTRFYSVKNGLQIVPDGVLVAVHDGVRPLVSRKTIAESYRIAEEKGAAVPCLSLSDSVRLIEDDGSRAFDRHLIKRVQTPQTFRSNILKRAYTQEYLPSFTDDASVVEAIGQEICLFEGNRENLKITRSFDLIVMDCYMRKKAAGLLDPFQKDSVHH